MSLPAVLYAVGLLGQTYRQSDKERNKETEKGRGVNKKQKRCCMRPFILIYKITESSPPPEFDPPLGGDSHTRDQRYTRLFCLLHLVKKGSYRSFRKIFLPGMVEKDESSNRQNKI